MRYRPQETTCADGMVSMQWHRLVALHRPRCARNDRMIRHCEAGGRGSLYIHDVNIVLTGENPALHDCVQLTTGARS